MTKRLWLFLESTRWVSNCNLEGHGCLNMFLTLYHFQVELTKNDPDLEKKRLILHMASLSKSLRTELLRSTHLVALRDS